MFYPVLWLLTKDMSLFRASFNLLFTSPFCKYKKTLCSIYILLELSRNFRENVTMDTNGMSNSVTALVSHVLGLLYILTHPVGHLSFPLSRSCLYCTEIIVVWLNSNPMLWSVMSNYNVDSWMMLVDMGLRSEHNTYHNTETHNLSYINSLSHITNEDIWSYWLQL